MEIDHKLTNASKQRFYAVVNDFLKPDDTPERKTTVMHNMLHQHQEQEKALKHYNRISRMQELRQTRERTLRSRFDLEKE